MQPVVYGKLRAEGYDIGTEQQPVINYYLNLWQEAGRPTPLLEPMCGTGINLIPFLETGADIDGLDASPDMLAICRQKCTARRLAPNLYHQLLEETSLPRQYSFIFIPGASFGHIHEKAVAQVCLERLSAQLLPGGWLILDVRPPAQRNKFPASGQTEFDLADRPDGATIFTTTVWGDREQGRVLRVWNKSEQYVAGKLQEVEVFDYLERFYEPEEFVAMLQAAGFVDVKVLDAWEDAHSSKDDWIVFSARRRT